MYLDHLIDVALAQAPAVEPRRVSRFEPAAVPLLEQDATAADTGGFRGDLPPAAALTRERDRQAEPIVAPVRNAAIPRGTVPGGRTADPEPAVSRMAGRPEQPAPVPAHSPARASEPVPTVARVEPRVETQTPAAREIHHLTERTEVVPRAARTVPTARAVVRERELVREIETRVATEPPIDVSLEVARALAALPRPVASSPAAVILAPSPQPRREPTQPASIRDVAPRHSASSRRVEASNARVVEPHVHVTIGRVEVRATTPSPRAPRRRADGPRQGLADYLQRREGR